MPINELIAGGIKLPQFNLPDYGADLAQMAQIQSARNQNALAQYQLGAAQRAENENNQLRALFSKPDVDRSSPDFIRQIYAISPKEGQEYTKNLLEQQVKKATFQKTESDLLASDIERSAEALASAQDIQSYKAIHNAIHKDPNSRLGKYFASIGFDRTKADELITQAENDPSGQLFLNLRYMSGLKGKERADQMRAQTEAAQLRSPPQPGAIQSVGAQAPVPTENALGVPETGVSNAMVAQPAPTTAPKSRIDFVKSQIDQFSNVLSNNPSNKLAADRLKALTDEYNQLSAEAGRQATLQQSAKQHEATLEEATRHNKALENKDPEAVRAYEYAVKQGFKGTYADWVQSNQAKPADIQAYEYSLTQGFKGTLQDWMQSKQELPANVQEYEYARKQGYPGTYTQWVKENRAPGTNISIVNTPTAKSLSEPVGKLAETSLAKAQGAAESMESANQIRKALNAGNVIAGPLAGARTKFAQVLEMAGVGDKEKLANTRNAIQGLASMTLASRADLKGQGQITDMETKLLERAKSADIGDLTIGELHQIVNTAQKVSNRLWSNHQTLLKTMESDPEAASARKYYAPTGSIPEALGDQTSSKPDGRKPLANIFGQKKS